jgi:ATP-dependent Clp protease ATP-binding subunit ClpC
VVVLAQDEARALGHGSIDTEHLLVGLLREEEGIAARVLAALDVELEDVRARVGEPVGPDEVTTAGQIPFTPRAKKALELSLREALALGHSFIGTEHVLLGLVREEEGAAARILPDPGADTDKMRAEIVRTLGGRAGSAWQMAVREGGGRQPRRLRRRAPSPFRSAAPIVVGWALFGAPLGVGILVGRLIWG